MSDYGLSVQFGVAAALEDGYRELELRETPGRSDERLRGE
jgi:hypothetical protein